MSGRGIKAEKPSSDRKRPYTRVTPARAEVQRAEKAPQSTAALLAGKPTTLAGAMKLVAKRLKSFTRDELVAGLNADPDLAKIQAEASPAAFGFNLKYWSEKSGKLKLNGDTYTVVDLEF